MENYKIEISKSAEKTLFKLPKEALKKIVSSIQSLAFDPRPSGSRKLSGQHDTFRIRVGVYRIIYEVHDHLLIIKVLKVGHRKDIYK